MPSQRPAPTTVPPTSDTAGLAADLFRHVSADKASRYRAIMDVFGAARRQYRLQLRPDEVLAEATWPEGPPRIEDVIAELSQLATWGNLESQPDTARVSNLNDYYRARFLYRLSRGGESVEAALETFRQTMGRRAELQTVALEDITHRLHSLELLTATADGAEVDGAEVDVAKVHETLRDLVRVFEGLTDNAQSFMAGVMRSIELQQANATAVVAYKRRLIEYLERFIGDLVRRAQAIGRLLTRLDDRIDRHLQAEIASEIQRLLQAAERQLDGINRELHKRPTSTGVRFRLLWQPLTIDEGAPVGLEAARKQLMNTSADLWTAEDREVIGVMLHQRIQAEHERSETGTGRDVGGSLFEQLVKALDYRRWHRFQFERWQDGQWRRLSGPASSGERALGLTVPLFAAVASFYSQGSYPFAPRLILLDEVLAGIDDAARAHCMGLVREFDLDFVVTSEREWGCYAELPGVSICQLQRREGIDAVYVSRWSWDGRARTRQPDPDRRFPPVAA